MFGVAKGKTLVLSLAVHAYIDGTMEDYASRLRLLMGDEDSHLVLEGHPAGYMGEPEAGLHPLVEALEAQDLTLVRKFKVKDRELTREVRVYRVKDKDFLGKGMAGEVRKFSPGVVVKHYHLVEGAVRHKDHWGRLGIDATMPFGREAEFERKTVPGESDINLDDYFV